MMYLAIAFLLLFLAQALCMAWLALTVWREVRGVLTLYSLWLRSGLESSGVDVAASAPSAPVVGRVGSPLRRRKPDSRPIESRDSGASERHIEEWLQTHGLEPGSALPEGWGVVNGRVVSTRSRHPLDPDVLEPPTLRLR